MDHAKYGSEAEIGAAIKGCLQGGGMLKKHKGRLFNKRTVDLFKTQGYSENEIREMASKEWSDIEKGLKGLKIEQAKVKREEAEREREERKTLGLSAVAYKLRLICEERRKMEFSAMLKSKDWDLADLAWVIRHRSWERGKALEVIKRGFEQLRRAKDIEYWIHFRDKNGKNWFAWRLCGEKPRSAI